MNSSNATQDCARATPYSPRHLRADRGETKD